MVHAVRHPQDLSSDETSHPQRRHGGHLRLAMLRKRYGAIHALKGVSLDINAGEFLALLGPSGCGKTTLLGAIAGFVGLDEGSVELDGIRLSSSTPPHARNLGVVFQQYALFPHMTVQRNIAFPLEIRRIASAQIDAHVKRALEMVDLASLGSRFPHELSGGQQQRVALARALVYSPPVLLLDEPLGALDRRLRDAMQAELKQLHRRLGTTFIYVTHDQDEALAMADRVVVMREGKIEQVGTPLDLYERPVNEFVAWFVGECNVLKGDWRAANGGSELVHAASGAVLHRSSAVVSASAGSVAIRPEWLQVLPAAVGKSCVRAKILQSRFHGSETLLTVASPLGEVLVRVPYGSRLRFGTDGAEIVIGWNADETVLLDGT
jgi:putative spermidine/putrescine transport system ATP-binding protein